MLLRRSVARFSSISSPPPSPPKKQLTQQEIAAAFQKLGESLKIDKGGLAGNANVFAQSQQARDMRDLVKKRHLDQFKGTRYSEVDIKQWFVEMDSGKMPAAATTEENKLMFKRLYAKYKCVI